MKYGVREICDVVLRAKSKQTIGNSVFTRDMPVLYFDSLKTSTLEGTSTTVYAQGGRGNTRLIAWEGEKTVTFTMEDALISPVGLAVLSGAGLMENVKDAKDLKNARSDKNGAICHATEVTEVEKTDSNDSIVLKVGLTHTPIIDTGRLFYTYAIPADSHGDINGTPERIDVTKGEGLASDSEQKYILNLSQVTKLKNLKDGDLLMIDYYYESEDTEEVTQINIDAEHFAGNYYLEASTLWRNKDGVDLPAEFIIPNCKIQSAFTFSMASSGDPSTFTFTMDAFPDYTKYDRTKKVLCAIRVLQSSQSAEETITASNATVHDNSSLASGVVSASNVYNWRDKTSTEVE